MRKNAWMVAILLLAVLLRVLYLQGRSIWYDDAFSILLSKQSLGNIISGTAADTMPPLYYFLLHFWMQFSQEIWFIRLLSVLLSLLTVLLTYRLASDLFEQRTGLWAALLVSVSPLHIYQAQEVRMYALLVLTQLAYFWFFSRLFWLESRHTASRWNWVGLIASGAAAMYSHNLAIFGLVVSNVLLVARKDWRGFGRLLAAQVLIGLLAVPWLLMVPGQIDKIQRAFWTPRPGLVEAFQALLLQTTYLPTSSTVMMIAAVLSVQILVTVVWSTWQERKHNRNLLFLVSLAVLPPLLLWIVSYVMRPIFVPRGFLISSIAYLILIAHSIKRLMDRKIGLFAAGAFLLCSAISLPSFYTYQSFPRSPYEKATAFLEEQVAPGALVLHDNKLSFFPAHLYSPTLPQSFLPDEPGSHNDTYAFASQQAIGLYPAPDLPTAVDGRATVYFVVYEKAIQEYQALGENDHPALIWLDQHFAKQDVQQVGDLLIYQFASQSASTE